VTAPGRVVRREATSGADVAKGFDAVLGAGLAALSGGDDLDDAPASAPEASAPPPRTVALHPVIAPPRAAAGTATATETQTATAPSPSVEAARPGSRTSEVELVPARRRRWPAVVAIALVAAFASVGLTIVASSDHRTAPGVESPSTMAPAPPTPTMPTTTTTTTTPAAHRPAAAREPSGDERGKDKDRRRAALATLTVASDAEASVFVDGRFVDEAPATVALPPGRHTVRVEGTVQGLRLMPKEETVELAGGEVRHLRLDLR
jgi:hypothetical protein